eukprot:1424346-Prymnesium_polylepis.1
MVHGAIIDIALTDPAPRTDRFVDAWVPPEPNVARLGVTAFLRAGGPDLSKNRPRSYGFWSRGVPLEPRYARLGVTAFRRTGGRP